jgi:hypothetical protein
MSALLAHCQRILNQMLKLLACDAALCHGGCTWMVDCGWTLTIDNNGLLVCTVSFKQLSGAYCVKVRTAFYVLGCERVLPPASVVQFNA